MITGWWFGNVWNIFSIYWEFHHPNWRTHIFQRGSNHQAVIIYAYTHITYHIFAELWDLWGWGGNHSARRFKNLRAGLWVRLGSIFCGSWNHKNQDTLWRFLAPLNPSSDSVDCGYLWFANSNFHDQCPNCYRKNLESNILQDSRWRNLQKIVS